MRGQLFAKKPLKLLLDEMAGDHRLLRVLGTCAHSVFVLSVAHRNAPFDLAADVLAVELGLFRVELAVDISDLAHERRPEALRELHVEPSPAREALCGALHPGPDERIGVLEPDDADLQVVDGEGMAWLLVLDGEGWWAEGRYD